MKSAALLIWFVAVVPSAGAQPTATGADASLRQQVERRFDVLPLRDGIALRPKSHTQSVRSIEIANGTIALDGEPVSGAELRSRLGSDAELVLRLSYLDAATQRATFGAAPAPTPEAEEPPRERPRVDRPRRGRTTDAHVRIGSSFRIDPDETVFHDIVCIGGSADVQGQVMGDVVVIGGTADLGPTADVSGDVSVIGGTLHREPGAHVGGRVNEVAIGAFNFEGRRVNPFRAFARRQASRGVALVATTMRLVVLCLLACIVVLLGRQHVEQIGARAAAEPVKAGLIGLLTELLFFPVLVICVVVMVVTIIGIPLLLLVPFALLAAVIVALVGFTAVASRIGRAVSSRLGWALGDAYGTAIAGVILVVAPVLAARVIGVAGSVLLPITLTLLALGLVFEYVVWTIGIGALALTRFDRPRQAQPVVPTTTAA